MQSQVLARQFGSCHELSNRVKRTGRFARCQVKTTAVAAPEGPIVMNRELLRSPKALTQEKLELIGSMDKFAEEQVRHLCLLKVFMCELE